MDTPPHEAGGVPAEVTSFVGRRQATADVRSMLFGSRLVTLTGVGGVGKTRLALRVVGEARRAFADGVCLVELAKLADPVLVASAVVSALRLPDFTDADPEAVLRNQLADKRLLLVLDNCEHLRDSTARLTRSLLRAAPGLHVLATSRQPLNLAEEHVWQVPPLSVPAEGASLSEGSGHRSEAVQLFVQRATSAVPDFVLSESTERAVARLCQRLDGLPLAIELAAVRLRVLSAEEVLDRVEDRYQLLTAGGRDAPRRHKSLGAAIEWSFDLCSDLERTLWACLSVFAGDFDLEAAQDVGGALGLSPDEVLSGVTGLVEKSVVGLRDPDSPARYQMLETIRQFGREQLEPTDELTIRRRHRDHYLEQAVRAEANWFGPDQVELLRRFSVEQPNVWAALDFCLQPGETRAGMRLAAALWWYWFGAGVRDGRYWLDRVLALDHAPSHERAQALWVDGWISSTQGDYGHALPLLHECADFALERNDEATLAHAMQFIGLAKWFQGQLSEAAAALEMSVERYRSAGVVNSLAALALIDLGTTVGMLGDLERDVALCKEATKICRRHGSRWAQAWGLWHIAFACWLRGDIARMEVCVTNSLRLKRNLDLAGLAWCVELLSWAAAANGEAERAAILFGISERLWVPIGGGRLSGWQPLLDWSDERRRRVRETLGEVAYQAAFRCGGKLPADVALSYALGETTAPADVLAGGGPRSATVTSEQLTRREHEVAGLVAQEMSNKDIATNLAISQRTVECHVDNIFKKLGFTSRAQIATWVACSGESGPSKHWM